MSYEKLVHTIRGSFYETLIIGALLTIAFMAIEPIVSRAQVSDEFTITQVVNDAIGFAVVTADVSMVGTLDGLIGGTSYGTTTARVTTNNGTGYNMTIQFSSTTAMQIDGGTDYISNYVYSTGTATYPSGYDITQANAQFGFSVNASNTSDISPVFTSDGSGSCGTANNGTFAVNDCWRGASSTDEAYETVLIDTSAQTPASGSTSTVQFRITIPNGPTPAVPNGIYVATATLTATEN